MFGYHTISYLHALYVMLHVFSSPSPHLWCHRTVGKWHISTPSFIFHKELHLYQMAGTHILRWSGFTYHTCIISGDTNFHICRNAIKCISTYCRRSTIISILSIMSLFCDPDSIPLDSVVSILLMPLSNSRKIFN